MFDAKKLFNTRLSDHLKLLNRYLRYIFNGHFMIAVLFIIIALSVYYQQWLEDIPSRFPANVVMAIILGGAVSYNPIQTFLKEPDKVFLIVKEVEMYPYFRRALLYNYLLQLYIVMIALAVVSPLFFKLYPHYDRTVFIFLVMIILILKGWNLAVNWMMFKVRHPLIVRTDKVLRLLLSIGLIFYYLQGVFVWIMAILYFGLVINDYVLSRREGGIAWDVLIENDQHRLSAFYRFASMFAEVPQLTKKLKKHRLLSKWINTYSSFSHGATFDYLYRLTFIRSNDYIGLFVRLSIIGGIVIYFLPNLWIKISLALLFIYMTSFQLIPLFHHHRTSIWLDIYPVNAKMRVQAFLKGSMTLGIIQTVLFAAIFLIDLDFSGTGITLVVGLLFNYIFHHGYVKGKIEKQLKGLS